MNHTKPILHPPSSILHLLPWRPGLAVCLLASVAAPLFAQTEIDVRKEVEIPGQAKPILVSMSGLTGEAAATLQFDLYVQGFAFTNAESAQYLISGSNNGNLQARVSDAFNKNTLVPRPTPALRCAARSTPLRMTSSSRSVASLSPRPRSPSRAAAALGARFTSPTSTATMPRS